MLKTEELKLVSEWDKTFPQSEKVDHAGHIITARMNSLYSLQTGNQSLKNNMEKIV